MSEKSEKSSLHLVFFYMQSKETDKLTHQLCRLAKQELHEKKEGLPDDVTDDVCCDKVLEMIERIEKLDHIKAIELLGAAYKQYQELLSFLPRQPSRAGDAKTPTIFGDQWEAKVQPEPLRRFSPPRREHVPTIKYSVVGEGGDHNDEGGDHNDEGGDHNDEGDSSVVGEEGDHNDEGDSSIRFPEDKDLNYSFKPNYLSKLTPKEDKDLKFGSMSNSPTVLTERFGELLEKEWSVAFKDLSKIIGEKAAIRHLLWVVVKASNVCATMATEQLADLENSIIGILVSRDPLNKQTLLQEPLAAKDERLVLRARFRLISYRRDMAPLSVPMLQKEIRRAVASELNNSLPRKFVGIGNSFMDYADKCIELVWLMYVHDPPMHLEWLTKDQEGKAFQTDLYKAFTRSGLVFDYCVWPVVRLRREGPLLAKGVAQGR